VVSGFYGLGWLRHSRRINPQNPISNSRFPAATASETLNEGGSPVDTHDQKK